MATLQKNVENILLELTLPRFVGYADTYLSTSASIAVKNGGEAALVTVRAESPDELIVPFEQEIEIGQGSTVRLALEGFSPLLLAENDEVRVCNVIVTALLGGQVVCREVATVTALPFDFFEGLEGKTERLATLVRPHLQDCAPVLLAAKKRLGKWKHESAEIGYGADKNLARNSFSAVYAALKGLCMERAGELDLTKPVRAFLKSPVGDGRASALELGVFAASALERAGLHPVLAVGKRSVGVGVWLYEGCFLEPVHDDREIVSKYISAGVNNLCFIDVDDLFADKNAGFTASETHFMRKLHAGAYEYFLDIRRCRLGGIAPAPLRESSERGYELLPEKELAEGLPAPLPAYVRAEIKEKLPRNKQWEKRLLDLTYKNALLNFTGRYSLHIRAAGGDELFSRLLERGMKLRMAEECAPFGLSLNAQERELALLEERQGILRAAGDVTETATRLLRRNRVASEETGTEILYLAFGFLQYTAKEGGKTLYAPLVLAPVRLTRTRSEFTLSLSEREYSVNATLLAFLKQEFGIDVRGLDGDVSALKISQILGIVRAETASLRGWDVLPDVYLSAFSFKNHLMWHDLRTSMDEFKKNALVTALLEGKPLQQEVPALDSEDEADPAKTLLPLPSDSSQYSAVLLSSAGKSFVLHGPPGTGKSQTIANMIANALSSGKRVLFVAEKKAALDVVKKRLDTVGIGEFCLELHSNKTDKSDVLRRLEHTLSLGGGKGVALNACAGELVRLRDELKAPLFALHKKHGLGISVYEAILTYLENENAPDVLDIESSFYDSLTEEKLASCRSAIRSAAAAAKECGGVVHSPFENVNLTHYSAALRDKIFCASEVLIAEIKHFKAMLGLFLEFYRQKVSVVTMRKIALFSELATTLDGYGKYFCAGEGELHEFYHANKRLDELFSYYYAHFRTQVAINDWDALKEYFAAGGDWRLNRAAKAAVKRLERAALHPLAEEDIPKYLATAIQIAEEERRIMRTSLSQNFSDRGKINHKKRAEFLDGLYRLHELAAEAFHDFHPDTFNAMCVRAESGYVKPVLEGLARAAEAFEAARRIFLDVTNAREIASEDIFDYYTAKAGALIDNIDMLANWCKYRATAEKLSSYGLTFILEALESGKLKTENVLAGFEKNICKNFLELAIPADPSLSHLTVGTMEETIERFRLMTEEFRCDTREHLFAKLVSRVPKEGELCKEVGNFTRRAKSNLRGKGLRWLFSEVPDLIARLSPCMLMSPVTVAQYLEPRANMFDLVIFDEASQMNTAEAIGAIARAKSAVVVGDPKQLPPTSFFHSAYIDTDSPECDDLESVLDDCLALGMPERHLSWHYRSKHESLIAFSNATYYENRLCTFPSPDALVSRVQLRLVDGVYERGGSKRNKGEAEALVNEVVRRLEDPVLAHLSMGIVTFSTSQQEEIEKRLSRELSKRKLESLAYEREEPLFVKNLENVQGDERDVILFSVCYGPDSDGKLSLNFGPLNQAGGSRRLNVAVSRAREEMLVFSTMTAGMIDLSKTLSRGVAGLKSFLSYAENGVQPIAARFLERGLGRHIAREIEKYGYECRCNVGVSDFKIDVCVIDPEDSDRFLLGILCDSSDRFSVKERTVLQPEILKKGNWNVVRVNCVNYYSNRKREIKRIKEILDRLTGRSTRAGDWLMKYAREYKAVKGGGAEVADFITSGENDKEILTRMREIVTMEEPISRAFLKKRVLISFGIGKSGEKIEKKLDALIDGAEFSRERVMGTDYFYKTARALRIGKFRTETGEAIRKEESDFTVFEMLSFVKGALESRVALYMDEIVSLAHGVFRGARNSERFADFMNDCVSYGEEKGLFVRSVSDRVSLA